MEKGNIEHKILAASLYIPEFFEKTSGMIKAEYFTEEHNKVCYLLIKEYYDKYPNTRPTVESILVSLDSVKSTENVINDSERLISRLTSPSEDLKWLFDQSEEFSKNRAIYLTLKRSIAVYEGAEKNTSIHEIPEMLSKAIGVGLDDYQGHDYISDIEKRYDQYTRTEARFEFDIHLFNVITNGGLKRKTLNLFAAGTGVGKSMMLCHLASAYLMSGKNVVYFTLEMAEESIGERIDANILDINIFDLKRLTREQYTAMFTNAVKSTSGNLMIKEYSTGAANANDFKYYLKELRNKKGFTPDVVIVDYLTICSSYKASSDGYTKNKHVAEELRALGQEFDVPVVSAIQLNRTGSSSSDPSVTDIGESYAIAQAADLILCLVTNDQLEEDQEIMVAQLKNRYNTLSRLKKFKIGLDRSKMKVFDLEQSESRVVGMIENTIDLQPSDTSFNLTTNNVFNDFVFEEE